MKTKIIILLSVCVALFLNSTAQVRLDPFYPYSQYTIGFGAGYSQLYSNLQNTNSEPVYRVNVERNTNEWVYIDLQLQHGAFSEYENKNHWTNGMGSYNSFTSLALTGRVSLGELFNHPKNFFCKTLFGLYVGYGIGYMINDVSNINLKFRNSDKLLITDYDPANIKEHTGNWYLPFSIGFNLHLTRRCVFNVNYEFSYAFSDYLGGYSFSQPVATNLYNDMYSVLSFGLHFYIGKVGVTHDKTNTSNYRRRE